VENPRASVENDDEKEKEYGAISVAQRYTKLSIVSPNMRILGNLKLCSRCDNDEKFVAIVTPRKNFYLAQNSHI
jgi:hypothetical protein